MSQCFMHGDLVNGLAYSVFLPFYYYKVVTEGPQHPHVEGLIMVTAVSTIVALSAFRSWRCSSVMVSWISYFATTLSFVGIGLYHWPHGDEAMLLVQFFWYLVISTANTAHTLTTRIQMGVISMLAAINLSYWSSLYTVHENIFYIISGTVAYIGGNVVLWHVMKKHGIVLPEADADRITPLARSSNGSSSSGGTTTTTNINYWDRKGEVAATLLLVTVFIYFIGSEAYKMMTQSGYNVIGGYKIVRAAVFGATGFVATGIFRNKHPHDDDDDDDVMRRRAAQTGNNLNLARFALDKSETATAYIDQHQTIQWCNASFVQLTSHHSETKLLSMSLNEAIRPSESVAKTLKQSFRTLQPFQVEAVVCGKILQIKVSHMSQENPLNGFFVVLQDVTEERSLEQFRHYKDHERLHQD